MRKKSEMVGIDAPFSYEGKAKLELYRKKNPKFKYARIEDVLQTEPKSVPLYEEYDLTNNR